jgi:hypothetical protein
MARTIDINDPEQVKTYIANAKWNSKTKNKNADSYSAYARHKKIAWTPPKYMATTTMPFIPTEQEIDLLISATGKVISTVLQTLKETGIRIGELVLLYQRTARQSSNRTKTHYETTYAHNERH